jgi:hypothetical protein
MLKLLTVTLFLLILGAAVVVASPVTAEPIFMDRSGTSFAPEIAPVEGRSSGTLKIDLDERSES